MQSVNFARLRIRLLKGGVAPKFVKRSIQELQQHLDELIAQEQSDGTSETEARAAALTKLGDEEKYVKEALAKKELLSWSRRYPRSVFLVAPVIAYFALAYFSLTVGLGGVRSIFGVDIYNDWPTWNFYYSKALMFLMEYMIAAMLALSIALLAIHRNVNILWPLIGILIVCLFGFGFDTNVSIPDERGRGGVTLTWGWPFLPWENWRPSLGQSLEQFARVLVTMSAVVLLFKKYKPYQLNID